MEGFHNLGNTCYINTALQVLFSCECFKEACLNNKLQSISHSSLILLLQKLLKTSINERIHVLKLIHDYYRNFFLSEKNSPEDAFEFIIRIIDDFVYSQEQCLFIKCLCIDKLLPEKQLFNGIGTRKIIFPCCKKSSQVFETFTSLPLYKYENLNTETVIKDVQCDVCKKTTYVIEIFDFHIFPIILFLECTYMDENRNIPDLEINVTVCHGICHSVYLYKLVSVIFYRPCHYTCLIVKDSKTGVIVNDSQLTPLSLSSIDYKHAKCFVYEQYSMRQIIR
jgi:Ubiquitin carboxyl-terminal hydrolase